MNQLLFFSIVITIFDLFLIIYAFTLPLYLKSWRKKVNKKYNNDTSTGIAILFITLASSVSWIIYFYFYIFHL